MLPPPATPDRVVPQVATQGEPPAGMGQVTIGIVGDEPSIVEAVTGHFEGVTSSADVASGLVYETVCKQTPCVANLSIGDHDLRITSIQDDSHTGSATITIGPQPSVYRYALGRSVNHTSRVIWGAQGLAWGVLGFGASTIGLVAQYKNLCANCAPVGPANPVAVVSLVVGMIASGGLAAVGAYLVGKPMLDLQEGTGVQWVPAAP